MINESDLKKYDTLGMFRIYDKWAELSKEAYSFDHQTINCEQVDHIVFSGMGGSGALGDFFSSILSETNIHVNVIKGYTLPKTVTENSLVIHTSISGNTVETLTILQKAKKIGCKIIAFSSGGKMEDYCTKNSIEYRKIKQLNSPRASFTIFAYSMLKILQPILKIKEHDITDSLNQMTKLQENISSKNLTESNQAIKISEWINQIPITYYPGGLQSAAIRFKNSLQENAKIHAVIEEVVESAHNGVMAWETKSEFHPILLRGKEDHTKTKEIWEILKEYFRINKINYYEVFSLEGSILTKLMNLIYLLDFVSIYVAIKNKRDPSPVKSIDFLKNKINQNSLKF